MLAKHGTLGSSLLRLIDDVLHPTISEQHLVKGNKETIILKLLIDIIATSRVSRGYGHIEHWNMPHGV